MDRRFRNESGSVLILVLTIMLVLAGVCAALHSTALASHRASVENLETELAYCEAESAVSYAYTELSKDRNFLSDISSFPTAPVAMGAGSFTIESATPGTNPDDWNVVVAGTYGDSTFRMGAAFGYRVIPIPPGVVTSGTGNPATVTCSITGNAGFGSFDSSDGPYNPLSPGTNADFEVNGSVKTTGTVTINGDVSASGSITKSVGTTIAGSSTPNSSPPAIDDIDQIVYDTLAASQVANDNGKLAAIFGAKWKPIAGAQNYGELVVSGGTYTVPAGNYRFKRFEVINNAKITFDTSNGPVNISYVGSGKGTGTLNDLIVSTGGKVLVDSKGSSYGLLTILGMDCDFRVSGASIYGQNPSAPASGGYCQIISVGGNTSSDTIEVTGGATVYGRIYAAAHAFSVTGASTLYGSVLARTVTVTGTALNTARIIIDESSMGSGLLDPSGYDLHARWFVPEAY